MVSIKSCTGSLADCSKNSSGIFCRICHDTDSIEKLISPCQCSGSMALVHRSCIEKWLSTANHDNCELCCHKYNITKHPRPFVNWLCEPSVQDDQRNLVGDLICFVLLTPLAAISTYLCASGAAFYLEEKKSESIGLICLCVVLVIIYTIWVLLTVKYHISVWFVWREKNQEIRLTNVGEDPISATNWRNPYSEIEYESQQHEESSSTASSYATTEQGSVSDRNILRASQYSRTSHDSRTSQDSKDPPTLSSFGQDDVLSRDPRIGTPVITPNRSIQSEGKAPVLMLQSSLSSSYVNLGYLDNPVNGSLNRMSDDETRKNHSYFNSSNTLPVERICSPCHPSTPDVDQKARENSMFTCTDDIALTPIILPKYALTPSTNVYTLQTPSKSQVLQNSIFNTPIELRKPASGRCSDRIAATSWSNLTPATPRTSPDSVSVYSAKEPNSSPGAPEIPTTKSRASRSTPGKSGLRIPTTSPPCVMGHTPLSPLVNQLVVANNTSTPCIRNDGVVYSEPFLTQATNKQAGTDLLRGFKESRVSKERKDEARGEREDVGDEDEVRSSTSRNFFKKLDANANVDENQIPVISDRTNHGDKRLEESFEVACNQVTPVSRKRARLQHLLANRDKRQTSTYYASAPVVHHGLK